MTPVRVGLVGSSLESRLQVARRWRSARLVACGMAATVPQGWRDPQSRSDFWVDDWSELLAPGTDRLDALLIADEVQAADWRALASQGADAGRHIALESFAELTPEEFHGWSLRCAARGGRFVAGNPLRHRASVEGVQQALQSGRLGSPGIVRLHAWQSASLGEPRGAGGIPSAMLRLYADLVCWLFQGVPDRVFALPIAAETEAAGPRGVALHLGFPGGGMALVDLVGDLPPGDVYWSLSVIGSSGAAYADDHHNRQLMFAGGTARAECTGEGEWPLLRLQTTLLEALAGQASAVMLSDVERATRVTAAIEAALATGEAQPGPTGETNAAQ